ncbi:hypothetical protein LOTGIDRAFT_132375 [Lottia gigantea]|uniref:UBX domain-containing protein n=1 Tax=Lottia gigantea TaxID=225164 RepID=V3ZTQ5_LOTGI|nr:hypothetical protein LOTGIDRAFT_132375 [Lottia gigantea]ESO84306.1 hypothetical protein LOTGIDRAFT_132375 [Lottia gigantea]
MVFRYKWTFKHEGNVPIEVYFLNSGADRDVGGRLLEACNNNLEMAIGMHMDVGDVGQQGDGQCAPSAADLEQFIDDVDDVRAPIPQKREVLVEEGPVLAYRGRRRPAASVFDGFRDFQAETRQQEENLNSASSSTQPNKAAKQRTLEDLFRPPIDITFKGTFQKAREAGQNKKKWLLVNIQNVQEFQCQVLNRDVWSNEAVRGMIKQHFIFWQVYHDSEEGTKYIQFYKVVQWPYIAIIDPITGENMMNWNTMDALKFCDNVSEFLAVHSSLESNSDSSPPRKRLKKNSLVDATEEAQLEAAIKASMVQEKKKVVFETDSDCDSDVETFSDSDEEPINTNNSGSKGTKTSKNAQKTDVLKSESNGEIASGSHDQSVSNNNVNTSQTSESTDSSYCLSDSINTELTWEHDSTNLMVRFPDGKREQLSIPCSSKLMALVKFAASKGFSPERFELVTNFPRRQLSYLDMKQTIQKAGLHPQETVFVQARS